MRHVAELTLHNWGPFRGTHHIELGPHIYAVVAQHNDDPDRSNWIGKTWFLDSMLFALTGVKPESCRTEDDWITHGEPDGYVQLVTDNGVQIKRSRQRTRSTQLTMELPNGNKSRQAPAQEIIYKAMGMDAGDLLATCFIRQKDIARLILTDATDRTKIVGGWVELGPLQRAEQAVRDELQVLLKKLARVAAPSLPPGDPAELSTTLQTARRELAEARAELEMCTADVTTRQTWDAHARNVVRLEEIRREGSTLAMRVARELPDLVSLKAARRETSDVRSAAMDREYQLRALLGDDWDSKCPLTCEDCPAPEDVRAIGLSMEIEHGEAEQVADEADQKAADADTALATAQTEAHQRTADEATLGRLRTEAEGLLPSETWLESRSEPDDAAEVSAQVNDLSAEITDLATEIAGLDQQLAAHEAYDKALQKDADAREELEGQIRTHREAIAVLGRQGAQREVGEGALHRIEMGANDLLAQAAIDLRVEVRWAREGRGLATHCVSCGSAFSSSQRVKSCDICGEARGPKLVEKLDIKPTDRSGAADDIGGLAFQLAASAWLRAKRSASWSSTCIDEPFAALDKANSRSLSAHLHALIRGSYAFDQGFLVAHDAQTMESLPKRIQIYGSSEGAVMDVQ